MNIKSRMHDLAREKYGAELPQCTDAQLHNILQQIAQEYSTARPAPQGDRKLYYFSAEFLMGKLLSNNLLALGLYNEVDAILKEAGHSLAAVEDAETEPSLGNGGLGRLAACFLDSIAALGLNGDGVGLIYHYGLFHQKFQNNCQTEVPDSWLEGSGWLIPTGTTFQVPFGFGNVNAVLWDIAVPGAHTGIANRLHLFDVENPAPAPQKGIDFDQTDLPAHLTSFLYPDDSTEAGRILRVYQQYFMVSAGAQLVLKELEARGFDPRTLSQHVAIQINDTHPSMVIPEMIRLLMAKGLTMDEAIEQVSKTCAYTNHTILAEALEKWPLHFFEKACPGIVPILKELDRRAKEAYPNPATYIIQSHNHGGHSVDTVHMAHLAIHYGYSVNGVAALHTEILKNSELKPFYTIYPEKFNNKTNGVTFRRWLEVCNPKLAALLDEAVGDGWRKDAMLLEGLLDRELDNAFLQKLLDVKQGCKVALADSLQKHQGITISPDSILDIQVKRLHEYKRQQMNCLYVIRKYLDIKAGILPKRPITVIFGAKAAPAYYMAKNIIHLILTLQKLTEGDPQVAPWLRVVMVENYNVTWAARLIPACDLSEQISLASQEASGTGNMKFMANGAVTIGTLDGANVEIFNLVGADNIYTFGQTSNRVMELYAKRAYRSAAYYERPTIKPLVDFLKDPALIAAGGNPDLLNALWNDLTHKDWFMALLDTEAYLQCRDRALADYEDRMGWARKMLTNIARSGFFSSDRTIREYNRDIWHLN